MDSQKNIPEVLKPIISKYVKYLNCYNYYAWPCIFGSTAGPRGGIGGCTMTTFTIEAYVFEDEETTVYVCAGMICIKKGRFEVFKRPKDHEWMKIV